MARAFLSNKSTERELGSHTPGSQVAADDVVMTWRKRDVGRLSRWKNVALISWIIAQALGILLILGCGLTGSSSTAEAVRAWAATALVNVTGGGLFGAWYWLQKAFERQLDQLERPHLLGRLVDRSACIGDPTIRAHTQSLLLREAARPGPLVQGVSPDASDAVAPALPPVPGR